MRIGFGTDIHRLVAGRPLIIGGVRIESDLGAEGHSAAAVLMHAAGGADLAAFALGELVSHYRREAEKLRNVASTQFLKYAVGLINDKGYRVANFDSVVHLERPKLRPHIDQMRASIAAALNVDPEFVSVKAKTGEAVDAVGKLEAVRAEAIILLR